MGSKRLHIGVAACFFHPDPERAAFKHKTLLYIVEAVGHWLLTGGAVPWLIPTAFNEVGYHDFLDRIDGLVLQGGTDVAPKTYGEEPIHEDWAGDPVRDRYEIDLVRACMREDIPVFGICRGLQIINVALGGTLYQDIITQMPDALIHRDGVIYDNLFHRVLFRNESWLARIYRGRIGGKVNSVHHQAIKDVAPDLVVDATSSHDGVVEAVSLREGDLKDKDALPASGDHPYLRAVQWHPEFQNPDNRSLLDPGVLLDDFLNAVRERRA